MAFGANKIFRGTNGRCYFDGELMSNVKSAEAKLTWNKDAILVNGDFGEKNVPNSYKIAGTIVLYKFDSWVLKKYSEASKTGSLPYLTVILQNTDPETVTVERVALNYVLPDEMLLGKFENGTLTEEEIPFTADDYKVLDTI